MKKHEEFKIDSHSINELLHFKTFEKKSNKALSSQQSNFAFVVKNELY